MLTKYTNIHCLAKMYITGTAELWFTLLGFSGTLGSSPTFRLLKIQSLYKDDDSETDESESKTKFSKMRKSDVIKSSQTFL